MDRIYQKDAGEGQEAGKILDTSVIIEGLIGSITVFTGIEHPPCLKRVPCVVFPEDDDYKLAVKIAESLRLQGTPVGGIDVIIASMCLRRSMTLVAKDNDFLKIQKIFPELKIEWWKK